jgi:hypothetical protein
MISGQNVSWYGWHYAALDRELVNNFCIRTLSKGHQEDASAIAQYAGIRIPLSSISNALTTLCANLAYPDVITWLRYVTGIRAAARVVIDC